MTMDTQHPLDERLAAYADGDADVTTDAALYAHVTSCARCGLVVRDLTVLRTALADLPDLVPTRQLRFVPAIDAAAPATGGLAALVRRLVAPALVAGAALVLVGSVGMAGAPATALLSGAAGDAAATDKPNDSNAEGVTAAGAPSSVPAYGAGGSSRAMESTSSAPAPRSAGDQTGRETGTPAPGPAMPWLAMTIIGAALVIASLVLRWTVIPAAGTRSPPF